MLLKPLYRAKEFKADFGVNNTGFYALLKSGALKAHKVNGRTFVKGDEVERWLASLPEVKAAA